jgi:DNA-binding NarL/FixJ family response regulator
MSEAVHHLLVGNGHDHVSISGSPLTDGTTPHVLLVDMTTFNHNLLARHSLTGREEKVIECICQGLSNKGIAKRLALSEDRVKAHLYNIFTKFNVTSRAKLISLVTNSRGGLST